MPAGPASTFRPSDATLSVTKAARVLGVHANTIRAWSDAGRLTYYRINDRGDRRYRLGDLQRFLAAASGTLQPAARPDGRDPRLTRSPARGRAIERPSNGRDGIHRFGPGPDAVRVTTGGVAPGALDLFAELTALAADVAASGTDPTAAVGRLARAVSMHVVGGPVVIFELRGDELVPIAGSGADAAELGALPRTYGPLAAALDNPGAAIPADLGDGLTVTGRRHEVVTAIPGADGPWGVLVAAADTPIGSATASVLPAVARTVCAVSDAAGRGRDVAHRLHRADALRRVAHDIGSHKQLDQILSGLVDHALVLFGGDRAAVFMLDPDGGTTAAASRGLSEAYLAAVRERHARSLAAHALAAHRPLFSVHYQEDPRGADLRAAVVQEGFDSVCVAPLMEGGRAIGLLNVYHDRPHHWTEDELETIASLAGQASLAIAGARDYAQLATWAAQLGSIQHLGTKLNRLTRVKDIGLAIATELRQLIDYHNVRVYRLYGEELVPVALRGQIGEYVDETPEQLRVKLGAGITGWVALNREPIYLADAARDPRVNTIPGTEEGLPESMLLAPMVFEDQVLGVLVLSKLGLDQFHDDDLRLLVIYASFAAQAMATADTTERLQERSAALERQLRNQRELLSITETILRTLDPGAILELVAERLGELVGFDNLAIELEDAATGGITPVLARGVDAARYMEPWKPGEPGLAPWVIEHDTPVLVLDERLDPRIAHLDGIPVTGSMIAVPLRGREGATGVLALERVSADHPYTEEEFELVQLFAAQVSIALQNAETLHGVEVRAATDDLTGLYDDGAFRERLATRVTAAEPFSLIMLDLDGFKGVNDTLGHQAGDRLLREIADAIGRAARDTDLTFRYGGDEFTVLLPGADAEAARRVAERVLSTIEAVGGPGTPWRTGGATVGASIGISTFPVDGATPEEILLAADRACFVAKRRGGGRVATAAEGLALAGEMALQAPTPIDPARPAAA